MIWQQKPITLNSPDSENTFAKGEERHHLVVAKGDARLDNKKLKSTFGAKARMLSSDEVVSATGHPVDGVCPFGLETPISVYCDVSLKHYAEVLPAAGAIHSAVRITPERMAELTSATGLTCVSNASRAKSATKPGTKHVNVACHEAACIKGAGSPARRYSRISAASSNPASELTPSLDITLNLCARMVLMFRSS